MSFKDKKESDLFFYFRLVYSWEVTLSLLYSLPLKYFVKKYYQIQKHTLESPQIVNFMAGCH